MKERSIKISLNKAKELYNSGNKNFMDIALQAFTEKELSTVFKDIKCINDVLVNCPISELEKYRAIAFLLNEKQEALLVLELIRATLNKGYTMKPMEGNVFYPFNPLVALNSTFYAKALKEGNMKEIARIAIEGEEYKLLGGTAYTCGYKGVLCFDPEYGVPGESTAVSFLGCATKEIAEHMGLYFGREIFDAQYKGMFEYEWQDE